MSRPIDMAQARIFRNTLRADCDAQIRRLLACGLSLAEVVRLMNVTLSRVKRVRAEGAPDRQPSLSAPCPTCAIASDFQCATCAGTGKVLIK